MNDPRNQTNTTDAADTRGQIRQGDVYLIPIGEPRAVTRAMDAHGHPLAGVRIAGERTGHAHELAARVYDQADGRRVLFLERPGKLTHQQHEHQEVEAGWWELRHQREHVPASPTPVRRWD